MTKTFSILFVLLLILPSTTFAWGERAHHEICLVATHLVKNPELKKFLTARSHMMGNLCNIPDSHWRSLGEKAKVGAATHYMDMDSLPIAPENIPLDLNKLITDYDGYVNKETKEKMSIMSDFGTLWWRFDQFYRLALIDAKKSSQEAEVLKAIKVKPSLARDTEVDKKDYHRDVLKMVTNMGLMGHYIGDASQPYHQTEDYDGWHSQHGGIHLFYEKDVVDAFPIGFEERIFKAAKTFEKSKAWKEVKDKTPIEIIRKVSLLAYKDLPEAKKLDRVLVTSALITQDGKKSKMPARRKSPEEAAKAFERMITKEAAWSAVGLAAVLDRIYKEAGSFDLTLYKSYEYPFTPEFVPPDYGPKTVSK